MTGEEARTTMTRVASLAANAVNVAIGSMCPGFDLDPEMVEDLLAEALQTALEEIDGPVEQYEARANLLAALRVFTGNTPETHAPRCAATNDMFAGED